MKKVLTLLLITLLILTGCNNKEETKVGSWKDDMNSKQLTINNDALKAYKEATKDYKDKELEAVALLGEQVVAGTNYMFLCKSDTYKIVIIYKNLEGKSTLISVNNFDYTKYVNQDISYKNENIVGGWQVTTPKEGTKLQSDIQKSFDNAIKKIQGISYIPIANLGTQIVAGTNYAILCYGTVNNNSGIYLLTLYKDLNNTDDIVSSAYIDLADFNK